MLTAGIDMTMAATEAPTTRAIEKEDMFKDLRRLHVVHGREMPLISLDRDASIASCSGARASAMTNAVSGNE